MNLFRVEFKVRPAIGHARYWEIQFAFLYLWVFDTTVDQAVQRASSILNYLPFERAASGVRVILTDGLTEIAPLAAGTESARTCGFSCLLAEAPTGTDEDQFLKEDYWIG